MKYICVTISLLLLGCLSLSAFAADSPKLTYRQNKALYQAQKALEVGDARQCIEIVSQYLDDDETAPYPFYSLLGTCYYQLKDYKSASGAFKKALELAPENAEISLGLATCLYLKEDYIGAGKQFVATYEMGETKDHKLLYQAAVAFYMGKDFRHSKGVLKELLEISDRPDSAWNELLISCFLELKEWAEAQEFVHHLLRKKPGHEPYWRLSAQLYLQQQDYRQAASAMEVVNFLSPPATDDLKLLAGLYSYLNIPLRAADLLGQAYSPKFTPDQIEEVAGLYQRGFDYKKAAKVVEQGLKRWPDSLELKILSAQLLYQQGRYQELLQSASGDSVLSAQHSLLIGYAAWHLGMWLQAKKYFRRARSDPKYMKQSRHAIEVLDLLLQADAEGQEDQSSYAQFKP